MIPWNPGRTTTTTTHFTSGNNNLDQAMKVKMVADELLAATGTVTGATYGFFAWAAAPTLRTPHQIKAGAESGEIIGRSIGNLMYYGIDSTLNNWS